MAERPSTDWNSLCDSLAAHGVWVRRACRQWELHHLRGGAASLLKDAAPRIRHCVTVKIRTGRTKKQVVTVKWTGDVEAETIKATLIETCSALAHEGALADEEATAPVPVCGRSAAHHDTAPEVCTAPSGGAGATTPVETRTVYCHPAVPIKGYYASDARAGAAPGPVLLDSFDRFAQRQARCIDFIQWVPNTPELRARMYKALEAYPGHAVERAWERLPLGPVQLSTCLDGPYKTMKTERVRVLVANGCSVDLSLTLTKVISWQDTRRVAAPRPSERLSLNKEETSLLIRAVEAKASSPHKASRGEAFGKSCSESASDEESAKSPPLMPEAFKSAFLAGVHAGTAAAFRRRALKTVTTIGTVVFNETAAKVITVISDDGRCHEWLKESRVYHQHKQWREQEFYSALEQHYDFGKLFRM